MKPAEERREPTPPESPVKAPTPPIQRVFSPKRALAAFKADLGHKKKVDALISSLNNLNDFIAESNREEEYSPEKKLPTPAKKPTTKTVDAGKLSVHDDSCVVPLKEIPVEKQLEPTKEATAAKDDKDDKAVLKKRAMHHPIASSEGGVKHEHLKKRAGL